MTVALLHPGEMGAAVGACLVSRGIRVVWASQNRSAGIPQTSLRSRPRRLRDPRPRPRDIGRGSLDLCPQRSPRPRPRSRLPRFPRHIHRRQRYLTRSCPRDRPPGRTNGSHLRRWRHPRASTHPHPHRASLPQRPASAAIAALFKGSQTEAIPLDGDAGAASALKVCYAAWNKGETALLGIIRSLARYEGVDEPLLKELDISHPGAAKRSDQIAARAFKAWRWAGEMEEIAASFDAANLPSGFLANAEIYRRLADYKDCPEPPSSEEVSARLRRNTQ